MENRAHALIAGLFVICFGAAALIVAHWFKGDSIEHDHYQVVSRESVTGLGVQASVYYRGVNIGKVNRIYFDPENMNQILIDIAIDGSIHLPSNIYAQLGYQGITGLAYLQLRNDTEHTKIPPKILPEDARIPMRPSLLDEVTGYGQNILNNVNELVIKLHQLLNDENQEQIANILQNIGKVTRGFDDIANNLQPGLESFTRLTTESTILVSHLDDLLNEINESMKKVNQQDGIIDSLTNSTQEIATTIPQLRKASTSLMRNSQSLNRILHQLEENPQMLLFGHTESLPGPGEAGFIAPPGNMQ
ncbi:phospholipid/cholesterol/gamma-HCH transport system substrate-binding protein [Nitrosomonas aestuarii]|uniref:Phospholipid/cholesterol/gamma-HCH transport system substrate-binding protein n=1 Tax=Nitrosomonas aestuarii TaxID=52441 RepID=A0A1I4CWE2_9PROT|nr:MlaD family protein [Nitrosomonas aestuarii]SFK84669.1 phospholipid/cholesterol/gamma-HCH transport system substrate-binding protein [Nitrosomonas aestuarii]